MTRLRFVPPNLITAGSIVLGLLAIIRGFEGDYVQGAWFILWCGALDKFDGLLARLLNASSELGVQLDSFADFVSFGVAPPLLVYAALSSSPTLPFHAGWGHSALLASALTWAVCAGLRLARFNVLVDDQVDPRIFFGVPTTQVAALMICSFLAVIKYSAPEAPLHQPGAFALPVLVPLELSASAWNVFPVALVVGGLSMVSNLRMRKFGLLENKLANALVMALSAVAALVLVLRWMPEYLAALAALWTVLWIGMGVIDPKLRNLKAPPLFPTPDNHR